MTEPIRQAGGLNHAAHLGHTHTHDPAGQARPGQPPAPKTASDVIADATFRAVGFDEFVAAQDLFSIARGQQAGSLAPSPTVDEVYSGVLAQLSPAQRGRLQAAIQNGGTPPVPPADAEADRAADAGGDLRPNAVPELSEAERAFQGPPQIIGRIDRVDTDARPGTADALALTDAYDLSLLQRADGGYTAQLRSQVQWNFRDTEAASWTDQGRTDFIDGAERAIEDVWDGAVIGQGPNGRDIVLDVDVDSRTAGTGEHWNADVAAAGPGFAQSWVVGAQNTAKFDQNDVTAVNKGLGFLQSGAGHEFGHMIGLGDEYRAGDPGFADKDSIMNTGSTVEPRHTARLYEIAEQLLAR